MLFHMKSTTHKWRGPLRLLKNDLTVPICSFNNRINNNRKLCYWTAKNISIRWGKMLEKLNFWKILYFTHFKNTCLNKIGRFITKRLVTQTKLKSIWQQFSLQCFYLYEFECSLIKINLQKARGSSTQDVHFETSIQFWKIFVHNSLAFWQNTCILRS